jgi:soluble lytic murein transglycosylase-like protein
MTRSQLQQLADEIASEQGIPVAGFRRMITAESDWDPNALGPVTSNGQRAEGIAQFMPATSAELGVDPWDPAAALLGAARYLRQIRAYLLGRIGTWSWALVLSGYNWGMGNTSALYEAHGSSWRDNLPDGPDREDRETREYLDAIVPYFEGEVTSSSAPVGLVLMIGLAAVFFWATS